MPLLIRAATGRDLPSIESLLASFALPTSGVADHLSEFLIAEDSGVIVASAATEIYGAHALLRSVAVRRDYQGRGVGRQLVQQLLEQTRQNGVHRMYLLTTTAASCFQRLGFAPVPRDQVDGAVQASLEFRELCCATAVAMVQTLNRRRAEEEGMHD